MKAKLEVNMNDCFTRLYIVNAIVLLFIVNDH